MADGDLTERTGSSFHLPQKPMIRIQEQSGREGLTHVAMLGLAAGLILLEPGCTQLPYDGTVDPECSPYEDCTTFKPPLQEPGGTGGTGQGVCLLSPTGAYPLVITQGYTAEHTGHDVAGTNIYAVADGTVLDGNDYQGTWDCYSSGLCFGSKTCPCVNGVSKCDPSVTNLHYSGGSYSYALGADCYSNLCKADACAHPDRPCHNQITLEFYSGNTAYRFRAMHIASMLVRPGAVVKAGTAIAVIGKGLRSHYATA